MTRKEAIEILQGAIKKPNTKDGYLGQAIDMAIKALEQTDGDLISRQAVIDGLARIAKAKAKSDAQQALMGRSMFFVENLPSVKTDGDLISKSVLDQIKWERDLAISQLQDLGYELGEKPRAEETAELRIVGETTMHYECSKCGGDVDKWDKFCKHCGAKMKEGD